MAKSKKTTDNIKLVLESKTGNPTRTYGYEIKHFARFGKEIKVTPKANAMMHPPGYKLEFFVDTVSGYKADFVLFPECFNAPLMANFNKVSASDAVRSLADYTEPIRDRMLEMAVSYNINI